MELEEMLQHHGVKGMKWGVIRAGLKKRKTNSKRKNTIKQNAINNFKTERASLKSQYKSGKMSRKDFKAKSAEALHKRNVVAEKVYKNTYDQLKRQGRSEKLARRNAQISLSYNKAMKVRAGVAVGSFAVKAGVAASKNPAVIRAGKNVVQAMKNSPIRYVDGSKFSDVIDMVQ